MNNHIFSVSELSKVIGEVLQGSLFQNITIRGEIQSCSTKGRYTYIGLIDEQKADDASLTIVVGPYCDILTPNYKVGDVILVRGNLNYYKARGSVSFWPRVLEIDGLGQELLRLERLKQKLASEGIFSLEHKRSLPRRVKTLAVVTSSSGAVINDIRATLKNRFPVKLNLYSANVQGKDASVTLTKALQNAINDAPDLIILARGGGSKADLAPFNDEALVRTVYSSPIPIISAVGHQVDTSLTDLAADKSAITPTEAATFVGMSLVDVIREREELKEKLVQVMKDRILALENRLENHIIELDSLSIQNKLTNISKDFEVLKERFNQIIKDKVNILIDTLNHQKEVLTSLDPKEVLKRGYAYITIEDKLIKSTNDVKKNDIVKITLHDGELISEVKEVKKNG